jgi:3-oxoacyl-[acyl-carrier-protein] synthase II
MGSGIGGLAGIEDEAITWERTHNPKKTSPFYIPSTIGNMVAGHLSIKYGLKGPNLGVVSACTTSTHAIGIGMRSIQYGDADIIIAGGSECATTPTALAGFSQAKPCPSATTIRRRPAAPGTRTATASSWVTAAEPWSSKNLNMRRRAAPGSTPSAWASA